MLAKVGLISDDEAKLLVKELAAIGKSIEKGNFTIEDDFEDMHSKIEFLLTEKLGDTGKKIHTARSRNDQILVAMQLYLKEELVEIKKLWFSAYAESLIDDLYFVQAAYKIADQNPLGSAAGYGSSFPIDRGFTTEEMGFETLKYNVVAT